MANGAIPVPPLEALSGEGREERDVLSLLAPCLSSGQAMLSPHRCDQAVTFDKTYGLVTPSMALVPAATAPPESLTAVHNLRSHLYPPKIYTAF